MLSFDNLALRRGARLLLEDVSLAIHDGQHVGITGANGCGKSSLFQLLLGELTPDRGSLRLPAGLRIAHMAQEVHASDRAAVDHVIDGDRTLRAVEVQVAMAEAAGDGARLAALHGELDRLDGYSARHRAEQLLHGLGFSQADCTRPVAEFSGGWRIRLNLAQALMAPGDLLLLDEPNNHLDLDATSWLEAWLGRYRGTLLLISHDRDFLDTTVDHIAHIEHGRLTLYRGNYSAFERQRAERLAQQQALHQRQQQRVQEIEAFVRRFRAKATKARQAQSRLKELERMQLVAAAHVDSPFRFRIREAERQSDPLLSLQGVAAGYDGRTVLREVGLTLHPGSRLGLLGANGAGKSTLVKTLTGELPARAGQRTEGAHLRVGYFAQQQLEALDLDASALTHLARLDPRASEQEMRDFLGGFAFHGDAALAPIRPFSGGEKARLALAIVTWQRPNLLVLDEPTNHLDLDMRQALVEALQGFAGALVLVSHDRHLLRNAVDAFLLVADGRVTPFDGTLEDYHRLQAGSPMAAAPGTAVAATESAERNAASARERRQHSARQRARLAPLRKEVAAVERDMERARTRLATIERELTDASLYEAARKATLTTLMEERGGLGRSVAVLEERWLECQEALEELERQLLACE